MIFKTWKSKAYIHHIGIWDNFVQPMGDGKSKNLDTETDIVKKYHRAKAMHVKERTTLYDMQKHGNVGTTQFGGRFGSWKNFFQIIGEEIEGQERTEKTNRETDIEARNEKPTKKGEVRKTKRKQKV